MVIFTYIGMIVVACLLGLLAGWVIGNVYEYFHEEE